MRYFKENTQIIKQIINGMLDWVRVLDLDCNIIYMNKEMTENLLDAKLGDKCYKASGRSEPCENCISKQVIKYGNPSEKEEIINGKVFSVLSSPVKNPKGEVIAIVEVMRDVTEVKALQQEMLKQNKAMLDNLSIARQLQACLLPKPISDEHITFNYIYKPSEAIGGDFLDIFRIGEKHLGLCIADVSGHGVPASMLTVFLNSSLNKEILSPARALDDLFRAFNRLRAYEEMYITIFYAIIDLDAKTISYSNAGHNASPILISGENIKALKQPGIPLSNWSEQPDYSDMQIGYKSGDRLLLFTDGIIEIRNFQNELFGKKRLLEHILKSTGEVEEILESAVKEACIYGGIKDVSKIQDDITIALIDLK